MRTPHGVISPLLFALYIDEMLIRLSKLGYGCTLDGVFAGALAYADDVCLLAPSARALNVMLKECHEFSLDYHITFNSKKSVCIKYGSPVQDYEHIYLGANKIAFCESVKHLGNMFTNKLNDSADCKQKISMFIGQVNKFMCSFSHLNHELLCKLFRTYCNSFYGCILWKYSSSGVTKLCTTWQIAARRVLSLPRCTHRAYLGPLLNMSHIKSTLVARDLKMLHTMSHCANPLTQKVIHCSAYNSYSIINYKTTYMRSMYGVTNDLYMNCSFNKFKETAKMIAAKEQINVQERIAVANMKTLLSARDNIVDIPNFSQDEIEDILFFLAVS